MVAEYRTIDNETKLVIIEPEGDKLFVGSPMAGRIEVFDVLGEYELRKNPKFLNIGFGHNSLTVGSAVFLANGNKPHDEAARLPVGSLLVMVAVSWMVIALMRTGRRISRGEAVILLGVYGVVLVWLAATGATA